MFLHIRILWALRNAKEVPGDPSAELLSTFASRFSTEQVVLNARNGNALIWPSLVQIGTSIPLTDKSRSAKQIRQVEEHILEYLQGCIAKFGLIQWGPDLRQSAYSTQPAGLLLWTLLSKRSYLMRMTSSVPILSISETWTC
jgi:hypothetical protein